jgi:hypothetical protein
MRLVHRPRGNAGLCVLILTTLDGWTPLTIGTSIAHTQPGIHWGRKDFTERIEQESCSRVLRRSSPHGLPCLTDGDGGEVAVGVGVACENRA